MYRKILLGYNGSANSANALQQAASLARQCGAELHILGIVATSGGFSIAQAAGGVDMGAMKRKMIEQALAEAAQDVGISEVCHSLTVREGNTAMEIVAHARQIGADLVVLGHSDRSRFTRWFSGSTSSTLLQDLPCSLLIAP